MKNGKARKFRRHVFNAANPLGHGFIQHCGPDDALDQPPGEFQTILHRQFQHCLRNVSGQHGDRPQSYPPDAGRGNPLRARSHKPEKPRRGRAGPKQEDRMVSDDAVSTSSSRSRRGRFVALSQFRETGAATQSAESGLVNQLSGDHSSFHESSNSDRCDVR